MNQTDKIDLFLAIGFFIFTTALYVLAYYLMDNARIFWGIVTLLTARGIGGDK